MKKILTGLLLSLAFSSCFVFNTEKGSGNVISKDYGLNNFDAIEVSGAMQVRVAQSGDFSVQLKTDDNLVKYFDIRVSGNVLKIGRNGKANISTTDGAIVYVKLPDLKAIKVSGASTVKGEGQFTQSDAMEIDVNGASTLHMDVRTPKATAEVSGASTLTLSGETLDLFAEANGASTINGYDCIADKVEAEASGASTARVYAVSSLDAHASGASTIRHKGKATVNMSANGASSVKKED